MSTPAAEGDYFQGFTNGKAYGLRQVANFAEKQLADSESADPQPTDRANELERQLADIRGDIDQITVQQIFKPLCGNSAKKNDETWEITSVGARAIRELLMARLPALIAAHDAKRDAELRERLGTLLSKYGQANRDYARTNKESDFAKIKSVSAEIFSIFPATSTEGEPHE